MQLRKKITWTQALAASLGATAWATAWLGVGCTQSKDSDIDKDVPILHKRLEAIGDNLKKIQDDIQSADQEVERKAMLQEDKKLIESRGERLKYLLRKKDPNFGHSGNGEGSGH